MKRTVKVPMPDGSIRDQEGIEVPIKKSTEYWSELELEDGSIIRYKSTISRVLRVEDQYDPEGNPLYVTQSSLHTTVTAPPQLQRGHKSN